MSIELELSHYGVKGMRWGVRNSRPEGVSRSTNRAAERQRNKDSRSSTGPANFSPPYRDFYDALRDAGIKI